MIRKVFQILAPLLVLATGWGKVYSQVTEARVELDTNAIMIGDQIELTLALDVPANSEVFWPYLTADTVVTGIEIIGSGEVDTAALDKDYLRLEQTLTVTSFDSGYYAIPPIPFKFRMKGDTTEYSLQSVPAYLQVNSPDVDMNAAIKPIKPPLEAPFTIDEALPYIGGGLLLALFAAGIVYYLRKRRKHEPVFRPRPKPRVPAHVRALDDLDKLKLKKLWQSGKVKEFYIELTGIVRLYIEDRFGVDALEMTTNEIMIGLKPFNINEEALSKLEKTLVLADLVKFAKEKPLPVENDTSLNNCIDFVRETKPIEQPEKTEQKETEKVSA